MSAIKDEQDFKCLVRQNTNLIQAENSSVACEMVIKGVRKKNSLTDHIFFNKCNFKVAFSSGPIIEKLMKRYPMFSVQKNYYQIDQIHV